MLKTKVKECPCGNYEYSISFKTLGEQPTECYCPFCGAEDEELSEKLEAGLKKRKKRELEDDE
jgi:hypothetical protein